MQLTHMYAKRAFRRSRFDTYMRRQRVHAQLVNEVVGLPHELKTKPPVVIAFGNAVFSGLKLGKRPVPTKGFRRSLARAATASGGFLVLTPEFRSADPLEDNEILQPCRNEC